MTTPTTAPPPEWDRLLSACQKNLPQEVRRLVEKEGVSPSHANRIQQSALHIAALWHHVECVSTLLELGADPTMKNNLTGATPLHVAIQSTKKSLEEKKQCVELLLQYGGDGVISVGDFYGSIPADYCEEPELLELVTPTIPEVFQVENGEEMMKLLQKTKTAVSARHRGLTPLLKVVDELLTISENKDKDGTRVLELLQILLKHGADPNETRTIQRNGHLVAQDDGDAQDTPLTRICLGLKDAYQDESSNNVTVVLESAARLLHQHGASVDGQLLLDAARRNQVLFAEFLMQNVGVSPNAKGRQGMTALQFAARSGRVEMVSCLLANTEINVFLADDRGQTALDAARVNDKQDVVALLEQYIAEKQK